jgi:1,4-alpha-glucan branching enzyme
VIYTESHDDVANDQVRVPEAISPGDADSWWAKKRASLGSALVLTSPGIPMLFQGQELLEDRWFDDTVALDWSKASTHEGILRLHRDLITLRRDGVGLSGGLRGTHVAIIRSDRDRRLLVMHRWADGGPGDDVVVVANFGHEALADVRVGMPHSGRWRVRFNSDSSVYAPDFEGHEAFDTEADGKSADGLAQSALVSVGPYSVVVLSQDP